LRRLLIKIILVGLTMLWYRDFFLISSISIMLFHAQLVQKILNGIKPWSWTLWSKRHLCWQTCNKPNSICFWSSRIQTMTGTCLQHWYHWAPWDVLLSPISVKYLFYFIILLTGSNNEFWNHKFWIFYPFGFFWSQKNDKK
jgi:hypothetical protein